MGSSNNEICEKEKMEEKDMVGSLVSRGKYIQR
jgi:hypothetical protein